MPILTADIDPGSLQQLVDTQPELVFEGLVNEEQLELIKKASPYERILCLANIIGNQAEGTTPKGIQLAAAALTYINDNCDTPIPPGQELTYEDLYPYFGTAIESLYETKSSLNKIG